MFLGLPDPHVSHGSGSFHLQAKIVRKPWFLRYFPVISLWLCTSIPNPYFFGPPGFASGSVRQRYGSGSVPKFHLSTTLEGMITCTPWVSRHTVYMYGEGPCLRFELGHDSSRRLLSSKPHICHIKLLRFVWLVLWIGWCSCCKVLRILLTEEKNI